MIVNTTVSYARPCIPRWSRRSGEATPITAIREGSGHEVMAAVSSLLEDRQDG